MAPQQIVIIIRFIAPAVCRPQRCRCLPRSSVHLRFKLSHIERGASTGLGISPGRSWRRGAVVVFVVAIAAGVVVTVAGVQQRALVVMMIVVAILLFSMLTLLSSIISAIRAGNTLVMLILTFTPLFFASSSAAPSCCSSIRVVAGSPPFRFFIALDSLTVVAATTVFLPDGCRGLMHHLKHREHHRDHNRGQPQELARVAESVRGREQRGLAIALVCALHASD